MTDEEFKNLYTPYPKYTVSEYLRELEYLGLNHRIVPNDIPELYNIIYLYHDDLLYDFIIDSTTDKETRINNLKFHFNKYRKERIDRKKVEPKLYIGDGQFKKMNLMSFY